MRPDCPPSPDDGVIADYTGPVHQPGELAARLALTPGVVDHGLFPAGMVSAVLIGRGDCGRAHLTLLATSTRARRPRAARRWRDQSAYRATPPMPTSGRLSTTGASLQSSK